MNDETAPSGRAKGGHARAAKLSAERRSEIAKRGGQARHADHLPKVTHRGVMKIGDVEIPCFVLDDGRRVISGRGMTAAIGMRGRGQGVQRIVGHRLFALDGAGVNDLPAALQNPIKFVGMSPRSDAPSDGFEATVLQELCESILKARDRSDAKTEQEERYIKYADMLTRAFARLGIIALVDEATGYQKDRARDALATILEAFIAKELQPWVRTFPADYYQELFRLRGLDFPSGSVKRPQYFGILTNDIVYKRLAPGVLEELKRVTPRNDDGRPKAKYFQSLTSNAGYPKLREHLGKVIAMMQLSITYQDFKEKLERLLPPYSDQFRLALEGPDEEDDGTGL